MSNVISGLKTVLNTSGFQKLYQPVYQVLNSIIDALVTLTTRVDNLEAITSGLWTPVDVSGAGLAIINVTGTWVKIGDMVFFNGRFDYPATASGLAASIGGLPFVCIAGQNAWGAVFSFTTTNLAMTMPIITLDNRMAFITLAGGAVTNLQMTGSVNTINGMYRIKP